MNLEELLVFLDLETPDEFEYFEAMADLVECDEYIEQETLQQLFAGADRNTVSGLIDDYFEDILNGLPEDSGEIFTLLDQIRLCLEGLLEEADDDGGIRRFTAEFHRFRNWFTEESEVELIPEDEGMSDFVCLRDAITASRIERLDGDKFRYNFENALDYELDSYTMSFADLAASEDDYNDGTIVFDKDDEEFGGNLSMEDDSY